MGQLVENAVSRRRWITSVIVLVVAGFAVLGNAPAPGMRLVRTASTGANAPRIQVQHRTVKVTLPAGSYKAVAFWEYGRDQPALVIQARLPEVMALPHTLSIRRRPPELKASVANFKVTVSPGSLGRAVDYGQQVGWFAVQLWDLQGRVSAVFFEGAREKTKGYLSCGRPGVVRDTMAKGLAPGAVKQAFLGRFKSYQLPTVLPPPAAPPPGRKSMPPTSAPPRRK